jgi:hypothetical protein
MLWVSVQLLKSSDTLKTWMTARRLRLNRTLRGLFQASVSRLAGAPFGIVHTRARIDACPAMGAVGEGINIAPADTSADPCRDSTQGRPELLFGSATSGI